MITEICTKDAGAGGSIAYFRFPDPRTIQLIY